VHSYRTEVKSKTKMEIEIQHQTERTIHTFSVVDPDSLTSAEVETIFAEMNVQAILVNGKYYELS
jgi:hypothetical protein